MKTAMQELMDKVQSINERYELKGDANWLMNEIIDHIENSLEKEKEQIIDAYEDGYKACDMDEAMEVNKKLTSGDLYYNMNYNQNK